MSYHLLDYTNDSHGITPSVFAPDKRGERDRRTYAKTAEELPVRNEPILLEQDTLQQGPLRHPDFVSWSGDGAPFGYFLVVSPRVHELFQLASLPSHKVHAAKVRWPRSSSGKRARPADYFVYVFDRERFVDALDLSQNSLTCTVTLLSERAAHSHELPAGTVATAAEAWTEAKARAGDKRPLVTPTALTGEVSSDFKIVPDFGSAHFPIKLDDLDLVYLDGWFTPWVSDALWAALESMGATGFGRSETWDDDRIVAADSDARTARHAAFSQYAATHAGAPEVDARFTERLKRRAMILSRRDRVRSERGKASEDPIAALEERLDVKLPSEYAALLRDGELPVQGRFRFYGVDELVTLEDIDPDWSEKSAPQAVRALLVAVDDHGDYLGYLLREDSETQLADQLMRFHHETAKVSRSRFKLRFDD